MKPLNLGQKLELTPQRKYLGMITGLLIVGLADFVILLHLLTIQFTGI